MMRAVTAISLLALLATFGCVSLTGPGVQDIYCAQGEFIASVVAPMVVTSAMLMVLVLSLVYMASQFLKKSEYEAFVSVESHQLIVSVLVFVFIFGSSCVASQLAYIFSGGDMFEISRSYLYSISNEVALETVKSLQYILLVSQYVGSITFRWGASAWGTIVPAFPSFILFERIADFLLLLITPFSSSLIVQQVILEVIRAIMLPFVLPAAVALRFFPPTRDASAFLLAVAMGFGIVYPYTYVMHASIMGQIKEEVLSAEVPGFEETLRERGLTALVTDLNPLSNAFDTGTWLFRPLTFISLLLVQALFLPALSITLTIAFIRGMSKFISQKLN